MSNVFPYKRSWLEEGRRIAKGEDIKPKKEHVCAAINALIALTNDVEKLRALMKVAFNEAVKRREEQGLPIPPMPDVLRDAVR